MQAVQQCGPGQQEPGSEEQLPRDCAQRLDERQQERRIQERQLRADVDAEARGQVRLAAHGPAGGRPEWDLEIDAVGPTGIDAVREEAGQHHADAEQRDQEPTPTAHARILPKPTGAVRAYHALPRSPLTSSAEMLRRHATGFRLLLMTLDAVLAVVVLVLLSAWRFGPDWAVLWRLVVPEPVVLLALYAVGWVAVLSFNSLYRPRARWSILAEARDILRATLVMALLTLSVLFVAKLPDVSRLFLSVLFPVQAAVVIATRVALRVRDEHTRGSGRATRAQCWCSAPGRAVARSRRSSKTTASSDCGSSDSSTTATSSTPPTPWPRLGTLSDIERVLHEHVVDEVVICLPFSQWDRIDAISEVCEQEGKIVRIPMDVLDRALAARRVEELDGTPVCRWSRGPIACWRCGLKRAFDLAASLLGLVLLSPLFLLGRRCDPPRGRPGRCCSASSASGSTADRSASLKFRSMVRDAEARRAELAARNEMPRADLQADRRPADHAGRAGSCAARASTSCPSSGTCCAAR